MGIMATCQSTFTEKMLQRLWYTGDVSFQLHAMAAIMPPVKAADLQLRDRYFCGPLGIFNGRHAQESCELAIANP